MILIGEKHGIKENFELYLQLIKRFNAMEKINVFFETSYSAGVYINEYIKGNEIFPLKEFINEYKGTMLGASEFESFIISLKKYNQRAKREINFYGIDLEFQKNITARMIEYVSKNNYDRIIKNKKNTDSIKKLDDEHFEIKREKFLINNFMDLCDYNKTNSLCFMGAWHIRDNSDNKNFVKEIRNSNSNILLLEILYKNSKRTIKEDNEFKIIKVDDRFDKEKYTMYGKIGILKGNKNQGIILLEDCDKLKML